MFDDMTSYFDGISNARAQGTGTMFSLSPATPDVMNLFYQNLELAGYNLAELKPALEQTGTESPTTLVISCAGSGKTTFLELKLIHDYLSGELLRPDGGLKRIFISTFLKTGAEELKNSFDEKCSELNVKGICADSLTFSTLHAEYYSILTALGIKPKILSESECYDLIEQCCKSLSIHGRVKGGAKVNRDTVMDIACIITYARNRIDEGRYTHPLMDEYALNPAVLDKLIEIFHKHRQAQSAYDFEDLQELVYTGILTNPAFAQFVGSRYDYVLIDEFQDTSQIQYEILKVYINGAQRTIAIGDDDQCIYSWRGSDVDIITKRFPSDYNPIIHKFTVNYRCGSRILAPVVSSIKNNKNRYDKDLLAYRSGGSVSINQVCNVDSVMADVKAAIQRQNTVGILSRTNFDLLAPAILLELDGSIPFTLSKSVNMSGYVPRMVFGCLKLLTRRYTSEFQSLFSLFLSYSSTHEARVLAEVLQNQPSANIDNLDENDLRYSCPTLFNTLINPIRKAKTKRDAYLDMLQFLVRNRFSGESAFNIKARMFISFVHDLISNHSMLKNLSLSDIEELFTDIIPNRLNKRAYAKQNSSTPVRLTTVHEAKGKEWQTVILWNDIDGVFPALVGNHRITPAEFEEERRLHYIAFTRAKEQLVVYTSTTKPSPFLKECDFNATLDAQVEATSLSSAQSLPPKAGVVNQDLLYNSLQACINGEDSELRTEVMNILANNEYNLDKALAVLHDNYDFLSSSGSFASVSGNTEQEFAMTVHHTITSIMQTAMN